METEIETEKGDAEKLARVQRLRRIFVVIALVLLVTSLLQPSAALAYCRSAMWVLSGIMCLVEVSLARRAGVPGPTYANAILYFIVALLPLLRGR